MHRIFPVIVTMLVMITVQSCSKKTSPARSEVNSGVKTKPLPAEPEILITKSTDSVVAAKPVVKPKAPTSTPKVIAVNDKFAKKSVDGRFYYDLEGHRYWRSNKDGKYYLYNKSMQTDEAFKRPQKK